MSDEPRKRGLGRGLSALMADLEPNESAAPPSADRLPIELIEPNRDQPRQRFAEEQLEELAQSIRERGLIQPLIVRSHPHREGRYQVVAGERRWRAAQKAQLHEVPVVIRSLTDEEVLEIAIIENVQRVDLSPLEEAMSFQQLIDRFNHTQDQIAKALGKSRSHIANMLRLLKLPDPIRDMLKAGQLSAGHARALLTADDPIGLARRVVAQDLSVRETERLAKAVSGASERPRKGEAPVSHRDADTRALQDDLSAALGMAVILSHHADGAGTLSIKYKNLEQLDQLCESMSRVGMDLAAR